MLAENTKPATIIPGKIAVNTFFNDLKFMVVTVNRKSTMDNRKWTIDNRK
jgi:hypothetical protein